jgi:energy-coupling factor transport system substrate-specific component
MRRDLPLAVVSVPGLALFVWPFLAGGLPPDIPAWTLGMAAAAGLVLVDLGVRQLDARRLALLAALAAVDTALRLALPEGIGGFSPLFFLVLCAGYVFGPSYGFLVGAFSILISSLLEGGVGPWIPYQIFAAGWVGAVAGVAGAHRRGSPGWPRWHDLLLLAAVGVVTGYAFGALMDVQTWVSVYRGTPTIGWGPGLDAPTTWQHYIRFYLITSAAYDSFRSIGNALMILTLGAPVLAALIRLRTRFTFEVVDADL